MTDKKFTDEELIEALDLCTQQNGSIPCYDCPCWNDDEQKCEGIDYTALFDLINRQKAEIERLNKKVEELSDVLSDTIKIRYAEAKSEAYKEFAERLKQHKRKIRSALLCRSLQRKNRRKIRMKTHSSDFN